MNPTQLDPTYSEALRTKLVEQVNAITATHPRRRRRLWFGTGVFVGTCVLGGAVAVATGLLPLPGGQAVTQLGAPITQTQTGTGTVELGSVPSGATNVSVKLTCLSAGTFVFPDGASMTCSTSDAGTPSSFTTYSLSLSPVEHAITIRTAAGNRWQLTAEYVNQVTTTWKVNANGQTSGSDRRSCVQRTTGLHQEERTRCRQRLERDEPGRGAQMATSTRRCDHRHPGLRQRWYDRDRPVCYGRRMNLP
jgi:hypothetical protein